VPWAECPDEAHHDLLSGDSERLPQLFAAASGMKVIRINGIWAYQDATVGDAVLQQFVADWLRHDNDQ